VEVKQIKEKNIKSFPCNKVEKALIEWYEGMRSSNSINGTLIKEKAIRVAKRLTSRLQTDGWAGLRSSVSSHIKIFAGKVLVLIKTQFTVEIILFLM
jgi:hypothetical protein